MTEFDFLKRYRESFESSELGRIYRMLPLKEIGLQLLSKLRGRHPQGRKPLFPIEGEVALMFLRSYTGLSDAGLVEMLNGNLHMQMFCGVLIDPSAPIRDGRIVSAIRNRLASVLDMKELQRVLFESWKGELRHVDRCLTDATCYESLLRFPTDIKLLWECCDWLHSLMEGVCKSLKERQPRNKFHDVAKARLAYAKRRRPGKSATVRLQRRLLSLLGKLRNQWDSLRNRFSPDISLSAGQEERLMAVATVYRQQLKLFNKEEVRHRIVSIDRPYLRPIVRGKENRRVEFGAKVNNIQIDGISFIEHHSFEAFNEGIRLKQAIAYQEELTGVKVREVGADTIYANNENRTYCTKAGIVTSFARKGPHPREEGTRNVRRIIGNLRATLMEGSFGNQKQHYGVSRIAARNRASETLQLFFAIHMANAVILAERRRKREEETEQQRSA